MSAVLAIVGWAVLIFVLIVYPLLSAKSDRATELAWIALYGDEDRER